MKKLLILALSAICVSSCVAAFAACGGSKDKNSPSTVVFPPEIKEYNDDISYRISYTSEEECPAGNIDENKLYSSMKFEQNKAYFIVVDFTVSSFGQFGGSREFCNAFYVNTDYRTDSNHLNSIIDFTVEEVATSKIEYLDDNYGQNIVISYSVPPDVQTEKSYRTVFKFTFVYDGLAGIRMSFYGDGQSPESVKNVEETFGLNVTADLEYERRSTDIIVKGVGTAKDKDIVIPNSYWGYYVNKIADKAFEDCTSLTSIRLADTITSVGSEAFKGCTARIEWGDCGMTNFGEMYYGYSGDQITVGKDIRAASVGAFKDTQATSFYVDPRNSSFTAGSRGELISSGKVKSVTQVPTALTSYTLESYDDITSVSSWAFDCCHKLKEVDFNMDVSYSNEWFDDCPQLETVNIGADVTKIYSNFFGGSNVSNVTVAGDNDYFTECNGMVCNKAETEIIAVPAGISGSVVIPSGITELKNNVFSGCKGITSVTIPEGVTSIAPGTFYGCTGITTVNYNAENCENIYANRQSYFSGCNVTTVKIGDNVKTIPSAMFYQCTNLENVSFGKKLESIRYQAFSECKRLARIDIPDSVRYIDNYAFYECSALSQINMGSGVYNIGENAFWGTEFYNNKSNWKSDGLYIGNYFIEQNDTDVALENYTVRPGTIAIAEDALYGVKHVSLPDGLKGIGGSLSGKLEDIKIPSTVVYIGDYAFWQTKIKEVEIPASVKYIGHKAFKDNMSLTSVTFAVTDGWKVSENEDMSAAQDIAVSDATTNARNLRSTYADYYWARV